MSEAHTAISQVPTAGLGAAYVRLAERDDGHTARRAIVFGEGSTDDLIACCSEIIAATLSKIGENLARKCSAAKGIHPMPAFSRPQTK